MKTRNKTKMKNDFLEFGIICKASFESVIDVLILNNSPVTEFPLNNEEKKLLYEALVAGFARTLSLHTLSENTEITLSENTEITLTIRDDLLDLFKAILYNFATPHEMIIKEAEREE